MDALFLVPAQPATPQPPVIGLIHLRGSLLDALSHELRKPRWPWHSAGAASSIDLRPDWLYNRTVVMCTYVRHAYVLEADVTMVSS